MSWMLEWKDLNRVSNNLFKPCRGLAHWLPELSFPIQIMLLPGPKISTKDLCQAEVNRAMRLISNLQDSKAMFILGKPA